MATALCVVEVAATGALLDGGEEMTLTQASRTARLWTQRNPDQAVRILQGGGRKVVQRWSNGARLP
jgi:hypothetical protein